MAKLVCGCGYLGLRVARRWLGRGETVWCTTRSPHRADGWRQLGLRPLLTDVTHPWSLPPEVLNIDTVLFAVGFDRSDARPIEEVYTEAIRHTGYALPDSVRRLIYISSTGVYGQSAGEWVDEDSPCQPTRAGGRACLAAERWLAGSRWCSRTVVLRLAGIYGPGRIPKRSAVVAGEVLDTDPDGYLNLIHVDDAAELVLAAEARAVPPRTLVIADGEPVLRGDFYRELARLLRAPEPRFAGPGSPVPRTGRGATDKRIRIRRMRDVLSAELRFPSYREGLAAIVADQAG
ncbi:MAG: SDR family oxidoreductase [Pirellulaceae bacterium]